MANDGAPVCNLPNVGQVPPLQAGRMYPSVPKAQDLPSAIQAVNTLSQILIMLMAPGLPAFRNNLAPFNNASTLVGTPGINSASGANGSAGAKGKDGKKGEDAKNPSWQLSSIKTRLVKVENPEDRDQFVVVKQISEIEFTDAQQTNAVLLLDMSGKDLG